VHFHPTERYDHSAESRSVSERRQPPYVYPPVPADWHRSQRCGRFQQAPLPSPHLLYPSKPTKCSVVGFQSTRLLQLLRPIAKKPFFSTHHFRHLSLLPAHWAHPSLSLRDTPSPAPQERLAFWFSAPLLSAVHLPVSPVLSSPENS